MPGALSGIKVVDFGQFLAGPLTAMMLADNGADVIRIDPPSGPRWQHPCNAVLQRGKRSICLDLKDETQRETARRLVKTADVVIENFRPEVMDRLGLGAEEMLALNPGLIYCSMPGFSNDDPRSQFPAWEGVISAAAGLYRPRFERGTFRVAGLNRSEPVYNAVPLASSYAAFIAGHSIVAALIARERDRRGQRIEVPIFNAALQAIGASAQLVNGQPEKRSPQRVNFAVIKAQRCADGKYVYISPPFRGWTWFREQVLSKEERDSGAADIYDPSVESAAKTTEVLDPLFASRSASEWEKLAGGEIGTGMAMCQTSQEWLQDEHARSSRCAISIDDPELGPTDQAGYPITLSETPPQAQGGRHALDSDRDEILAGLQHPGVASPGEQGTRPEDSAPPLSGLRVIDLTQVLAGPSAARILAEYGAEVIKISNPAPDYGSSGVTHTYVNNGKKSILLDLKSDEGREILSSLIESADVFHQNFRLGVAGRLGFSEDDVRSRRPDIIYSSVNAHAFGGFRSSWAGHEELGQALTGMQVRLGGDGEPLHAGFAVCDYSTGHLSAFANLLGLFHRMRTGVGQHVRASLSGSGTYLQIPFMVDTAGRVWQEPRGVQAKGWNARYRMYQAQDDAWLFLALPDSADISRLWSLTDFAGLRDLSDDVLQAEIEARMRTAPAHEWVERFNQAGIGAHLVLDQSDLIADPGLRERGVVVARENPGIGEVLSFAPAARFSRTPQDPLFGAPPLGSNGAEIIAETGLRDRLDELVKSRVVAFDQVELRGSPAPV